MFSQRIFHAFRYFNYWLNATDEHSLHAPFVFKFYTGVIKTDELYPIFSVIEGYRKKYLGDHRILQFSSLGATSLVTKTDKRTVSSIARHSLSSPKFSRFLFRLAAFLQPSTILELGTSLGINTLYLSAHNPNCRIVSFEGCDTSIVQAKSLFSNWESNNIELVPGNIDNTLTEYLSWHKIVNMVYMDANHRHAPTLRYFHTLLPYCTPNSVLVLDDIHWSAEMEKAWEEIRRHEKVTLTIDLFDAGLVFFRPLLMKQHYTLSF